MEHLLDRFLRYVKFDTQSSVISDNHPSTPGQMELAKLLKDELQDLGLKNIKLTENGYLMAEMPSNTEKKLPTVGFIAHMDTSPDVSGKNVTPLIFPDYDGYDLALNQAENIVLMTREYPELKDYIGQTIITSDGSTLLGADDKAGIAAIMTALAYLQNNSELKHGKVVVAFTPDEEIGQGADFFNVDDFQADFAYTIDGGPLGELEYENFNAAAASIIIKGVNIHPGSAYLRMKNAVLLAMEFNALLPVNERPEFTRGYEGFFHLTKLDASVESAKMIYIIRDHDRIKFEKKKDFLKTCTDFLNNKYGKGIFNLEIQDEYYNMKERVKQVFHIVTLAEQAMLENGITPKIKPIRGGTDGARLSFMGLPCPNLFTGGHNFHSRYEFISLESMEASCKVIISIIKNIETMES